MKILKLSLIIAAALCTGFVIWRVVLHKKKAPQQQLFATEKPIIKTIKHTISTSGIVELRDIMHIGSIQAGSVQDIYVKEGDRVKKDQLLACIDTAKNNTEVIAAQHLLKRAQQELTYQKAYFKRQQALYQAGQLATNEYEKITKEYEKTVQDVKIAEEQLRKNSLEYESTKIKAPENGIVVAVYATKGMVANDISNIVLFDLAQDIRQMKATLDIDESEIGHIAKQQKVTLIPNCYPDMHIKGKIGQVSFMPKTGTNPTNGTQTDVSSQTYRATVAIDNSQLLLHPGMIVNATILAKKARKVLSLNGLAFSINKKLLRTIASTLSITYKPIPKAKRRQLHGANQATRFVWVHENNSFIQKAVVVGLSDNMFWEIQSGLTAQDNVIINLEEPNDMDDLYNQWFKGAL